MLQLSGTLFSAGSPFQYVDRFDSSILWASGSVLRLLYFLIVAGAPSTSWKSVNHIVLFEKRKLPFPRNSVPSIIRGCGAGNG